MSKKYKYKTYSDYSDNDEESRDDFDEYLDRITDFNDSMLDYMHRNDKYCPNCDACLNDQYDFDESKNVNVCSECGEALLNPNCSDEYIWYCNKCNDIMNNQYSWEGETGEKYRCDNCGAINDLSDPYSYEYWDDDSDDEDYDDNYESDPILEEIYNEAIPEDELDQYTEEELKSRMPFCPNCNSDLGIGTGFDNEKNVSECPFCGKLLLNPFSHDDYIWHCNKCNDLMNNQPSWKGEARGGLYRCYNCGAYNNLSDPESTDYWNSKEEFYGVSKENNLSEMNIPDVLRKYKKLLDDGIIDEEEFKAIKKKLLQYL